MKITVCDGFAMNPGDLSWGELEKLGNLEVFEKTSKEELVERLRESDIAVVNKVVLDRDILEKLPNLKMISVTATGYNNIDLDCATEQGIVVSNVPAYSTNSVVQMVFAHILNFTNMVAIHNSSVKKGDWEKSDQFCYSLSPLTELSGKVFGILGFGNIGKELAKVAIAFGMKVIVSTRTIPSGFENVSFVERDELFKESDFIALAAPLTPSTENVINSKTIDLMKKTAYLINTGRGGLVNEKELADGLDNNLIAGAGIDVLNQEPPVTGSPLIKNEKCIITPHIAWATFEARKRLLEVTIENIGTFISKKPKNRVN